ncbi:PAS domain S-box protein [Pseudothauera nasutitermitis]|uniref:Oxygen sensor histidine kinase NreB n=1 Tax=Pseudothauera nasutitermitis TaxID=2565930 RepID=A0A4S4ATF3_9RHOO|nr:PAS domain S-box protein [Pseudothauera nasutitermitis]THF63010.1 PAS domain S-box protein [Pseudothauera nasutitermitis]
MPYRSLRASAPPGRLALSIALIYAALSTGWIIYSDRLLAVWLRDPVQLTEMQTWKGLFFVFSTTLLVWAMIRYGFASLWSLQQRLADREAAFRVALHATRLGLWDYRIGHGAVDTSEAVARMLGHAPETFRETVGAWVERLHPEDRELARARFRNYLEGRTREYASEYRMRMADGSYRWFRSAGEVIERDPQGRPLRVIGTYLDIHEQVESFRRIAESEARARLYLERMPIGCVITDTDWKVVECNPAFQQIFGYSSEELAGRSVFDTLIPDSARAQTEVVLERLRAGNFDAHNVNENITRDGRRILCEWFNTPIRDANGEVTQLIAMAIDISARDGGERALADSHRRLSELSARLMQIQEEERGRLARELHDEIGQQLAAVQFNLHALAHEASGDGSRARLDDCMGIMETTIRRIRDRALDLRPSMLDDLGLGPALAWYCQGQAERTGVKIVLSGVEGIGRLDEPAETAAFRIVQESVNNALRHAQPARIGVSLQLTDGVLTLRIEDDGHGFDPGGGRAPGAHLGLAGMRERAELAGGSFELGSAPGRGTYVLARLPATGRSGAAG